ncbi:MAG: Gfo/Idh/MocA family oxidoreductase [Polyangiaceae bacterium]|nr:Gfo/Idh/MocA family oxidoreductase [Polyangiaceae bacterium]
MDRATVSQVALVGCGAIGSRFDEGRLGPVRTHARAFAAHPGARLVATCDSDPERALAAQRAWGADAAYTDLEALLSAHAVDVVSLATSTSARLAPLRAIVAARVPAVLCEKPLAETREEGEAVAAALAGSGTRAVVNFWRRFDPGLAPLLARARAGELGALARGVVVYGKGLNNNGSHAIDLVRAACGEIDRVSAGARVVDGRDDDPSLDVTLHVGAARVSLVATDCRRYSVFEIDLLFERGRLRLADGRARLSVASPDPTFAGYTSLALEADVALDPGAAFVAAAGEALLLARSPAARPTASIDDALAALRVVDAARRAHAADHDTERTDR